MQRGTFIRDLRVYRNLYLNNLQAVDAQLYLPETHFGTGGFL